MTYVISDLFGYDPEKLAAAFKRAGLREEDTCYVLGNVIDYGENSVRLLRYLMEQPNVELILGEHEKMLLDCSFIFEALSAGRPAELTPGRVEKLNRWKDAGGGDTIRALTALSADERADILDYVGDAPAYAFVTDENDRDWLLVHAGLGNYDPKKKMSEYTLAELTETVPARGENCYDGVTLVFGHTPTLEYGDEYEGEIVDDGGWLAVDTDPVPTLVRLEDLQCFPLE